MATRDLLFVKGLRTIQRKSCSIGWMDKTNIFTLVCSVSLFVTACGTDPMGKAAIASEVEEASIPLTTPSLPLPENSAHVESSTPEAVDPPLVSAALPAALCESSEQSLQQHLLQLINAARSAQRNCGTDVFPAADALRWNDDLLLAARQHSNDMATHNFFSHTGSEGSSVSERISNTGYRWRIVGENIAAGRESADETVADWLNSPGHCRNLMNPDFTEMAVACSSSDDSDLQRYWTNTLASPR